METPLVFEEFGGKIAVFIDIKNPTSFFDIMYKLKIKVEEMENYGYEIDNIEFIRPNMGYSLPIRFAIIMRKWNYLGGSE